MGTTFSRFCRYSRLWWGGRVMHCLLGWILIYYPGDGFDYNQTDFSDDTPFGYDIQGYRTERRIRHYHMKTSPRWILVILAFLVLALYMVRMMLEIEALQAKFADLQNSIDIERRGWHGQSWMVETMLA